MYLYAGRLSYELFKGSLFIVFFSKIEIDLIETFEMEINKQLNESRCMDANKKNYWKETVQGSNTAVSSMEVKTTSAGLNMLFFVFCRKNSQKLYREKIYVSCNYQSKLCLDG